ncbi:MAG: uracil-DNA glycosylase [Oscillospiraceae bacterium]|jgi:DNA polymerase|nr:uracil-DNA glycosylase [Oscillospiraceae bacterium]
MKSLSELKNDCTQCFRCELGKTRTNLVFGTGNPNADIMFIGEGPGEQEDLRGEPFVGRGGKLLDQMLELINLSRSEVYIANIVKCRPPNNRDPLPAERAACSEWLTAQIQLINPRIIVCLGRIAAICLIKPDFKITREHGKWEHFADGCEITAIYHPAALLRDPLKRPETFVDLKSIQEKYTAL